MAISFIKARLLFLRNWISLLGGGIIVASGFSFLLLFLLDFFSTKSNPYIGLLAYLVAPLFFFLGLGLMLMGWFLHRWKKAAHPHAPSSLVFDLSIPGDRRKLIFSVGTLVLLLFVSAMGSYQSYHYTESPQFCGQACHMPMDPQYTVYQASPHARVACVECHVGSGAASFINSKLRGVHQVYALALNKVERPIKIHHALLPAQETCEQCHWPQKFMGNIDRTRSHYLSDPTNTPYSVRLLLKVGGGTPTSDREGGIHWHVNPENKVEYISTDPEKQVIPWIRFTNSKGVVTEYVSPGFKDKPEKYQIHRMDCLDCHNRPSHVFKAPHDAIDLALSVGALDPTWPEIKKTAVEVLSRKYSTKNEALRKIEDELKSKYPDRVGLKAAINEVQKIYAENFFPEMLTDWKSHPNNIGHKEWPGCFRCHDEEHVTADKKKVIAANDCNACHLILAQGNAGEIQKLDAKGQLFHHPGDPIGETKCTECHAPSPKP